MQRACSWSSSTTPRQSRPTTRQSLPMAEPTVVTDTMLSDRWPLDPPDQEVTKNERGTVLVVGGARSTPGAVLLAGIAALRVGAGRLTVATCEDYAGSLGVAMPEAGVFGLPTTEGGGLDPRS